MEAQLRTKTTKIKSELARRKLELQQMEVKKQLLDMARVRLKAYQVAEEIENEKDPIEDNLSCASLIQTTPASLPAQEPKHLRSESKASKVTQPTQPLQDVHKSPTVLQESSSADKTAKIVTTIADSFSLRHSEPIHYPDW